MENKRIFETGDTVYHHQFGWGEVIKIDNNLYPISVEFQDNCESFTEEGELFDRDTEPTLSFTKYNIVNGGFSQEIPKPNIKKGQLIFVRSASGNWYIRRFHSWNDNKVVCYNDSSLYLTSTWPYGYSIEDPLKDYKF